ncbi:alpha/beta fold hydrolase [Enterococcus sp.]|uniref:alpha/beta fold hydrolase n=1 Tax=Enterococcus sp. TaxID=35783 RepID=UPI0025C55DCF|nr:alpha/beta fold hydrolase [Enterococcus sp.]
MKKWLFLCLVLFLSGCQGTAHTDAAAPQSSQQQQETTASTETSVTETIQKTTTPTLFVHGYQGGPASFGGMLQRFAQKDWVSNEMVLTISPDGTISTEGQLSKEAVNPTIQVLFADNQNNEWNQAEWIRQALLYLKKAGVDQVNLVGHSMGGVSGFRYLTTFGEMSTTDGIDPALPKVAKFIAIGAPFNEFIDTSSQQTVADLLSKGPTETSPRYQEFQGLIKESNHPLSIELIAGQLSDEDLSDGTVPTTSALAINHLLTANGYSVTEKIIEGSQSQHSQLHENQEVDEEIAAFLWED